LVAFELPLDHELSDDELAAAVARAILEPQLNPGSGHPFNVDAAYFVHSLLGPQEGYRLQAEVLRANGRTGVIERRLNELCWR
jgi:hypothetical protein